MPRSHSMPHKIIEKVELNKNNAYKGYGKDLIF